MTDNPRDELPSTTKVVDGIPVMFVESPSKGSRAKLALWIPPFTGSKESTLTALENLAGMGFLAISLDPWQHGERGFETAEQLVARVFEPGNFRRSMWPIIGQTTLDARRVITWALDELIEATTVVAGGLSMGGDIAVALAGIDQRVSRVAAIVATPDWTRPGMRSFHPPYDLIDQGDSDRYADWFYSELNPTTHLERYERNCEITFECAAADTHVPPDGALRFRDALGDGPAEIRVNLHSGLGHGGGSQPTLFQNCIDWLIRD